MELLLGTFKISVNNLMRVQVVHPAGNLLGPHCNPVNCDVIFLILEQIEQSSIWTELHNDPEVFLGSAKTLKLNNIRMVQLLQYPQIGVF